MFTKRTAIIEAKKFLNDCKALPIKIDKAILFGSFAKGKPTENSDIDLALFSEKFSDNVLNNIDLIGLVNIRYPEIDAHTYPTKYFNNKGLLMDEIKRTGIEIAF